MPPINNAGKIGGHLERGELVHIRLQFKIWFPEMLRLRSTAGVLVGPIFFRRDLSILLSLKVDRREKAVNIEYWSEL